MTTATYDPTAYRNLVTLINGCVSRRLKVELAMAKNRQVHKRAGLEAKHAAILAEETGYRAAIAELTGK
jgi:hypothetical protein